MNHYDAVLALLEPLPFTLYEGNVPDEPEFPYAVLYMDTGRKRVSRLSGDQGRNTFDFHVNSVGLSVRAARIVSDRVEDLLLGKVLQVDGWKCAPIRQISSIPVRADTDVTLPGLNRHPMFAVDSYSFVSYAA